MSQFYAHFLSVLDTVYLVIFLMQCPLHTALVSAAAKSHVFTCQQLGKEDHSPTFVKFGLPQPVEMMKLSPFSLPLHLSTSPPPSLSLSLSPLQE